MRDVLSVLGLTEVSRLTGGVVNDVRLVRRDGQEFVFKALDDAPDGLFTAEAAGLDVLRTRGGLRTPEVVDVGTTWLLLEALVPRVPEDGGFWERAGRAVAGLHGVRGERFGWEQDGWLGALPQHNQWQDDGHVFFAEQRLLRYLEEPRVEAVLTAGDRAALERLCARLPQIVPAAPPSLTHGDLWHDNVVATAAGEPAFIDPAVSWMWPEVDLSMMYCADRSPARFFDAYHEVRPLAVGWRERMPVLFLRELLSTLAHEDGNRGALEHTRAVLRPFRTG